MTEAQKAANRGRALLRRGHPSRYNGSKEEQITDALTDLLHVARERGMDVEALQAQVWRHYTAEIHDAARTLADA